MGNAPRLGRLLTALGCARAATGEFSAAEADLGEAYAILSEAKGATEQDREDVLRGLVNLYEAWRSSEPDKGYDTKMA